MLQEHKPHVIVSMLSSDNKPHNAVSGCGRAVVAALAELKLVLTLRMSAVRCLSLRCRCALQLS